MSGPPPLRLQSAGLDEQFARRMDFLTIEADGARFFGNQTIRRLTRLSLRITDFGALYINRGQSECRRPSLWPRLILLVYLFSMLLRLKNMPYNYAYDYHLYQLQQIRDKPEALARRHFADQWATANLSLGQLKLLLMQRVNEASRALKTSGSVYAHQHFDTERPARAFAQLERLSNEDEHVFAIECSYLFLVMLGYAVYLNALVQFNSSAPLNVYFVNIMLNPRAEQRRLNAMIRGQVNKILESCRIYTEKFLALEQRRHEPAAAAQPPTIEGEGKRHAPLDMSQACRRLLDDYCHCASSLRMMTLRGDFKLPTRAPHWVDRLACVYVLFSSLTHLLILTVGVQMHRAVLPAIERVETLAEYGLVCSISFNLLVVMTAGIFFVAIAIIFIADHLALSSALQRRLCACVRLNSARYNQIRRSVWTLVGARHLARAAPNAHLAELTHLRRLQMNESLVSVLIQYKIFVEHLQANRRFMWFISTGATALFALATANFRMHSSYLDEEVKLPLAVVCVVQILYCDLFLLPLCQLHNRCLKLTRSLGSLLAHLVEVQSHDHWMLAALSRLDRAELGAEKERDDAAEPAQSVDSLYNRHTVWLIRQEFLNQSRLIDEFRPKLMGVSFTYPSLLRAHFWLGLVLLSVWLETSQQSADSIADRLFTDPLGMKRPVQLAEVN